MRSTLSDPSQFNLDDYFESMYDRDENAEYMPEGSDKVREDYDDETNEVERLNDNEDDSDL